MFLAPQSSNFEGAPVEPSNFDEGYVSSINGQYDPATYDYGVQHLENYPPNHNLSVDEESKISAQPATEGQIRFLPFEKEKWASLMDESYNEVTITHSVDADKGFIYSPVDKAFICKKKNHFQLTTITEVTGVPIYVRTLQGPKQINEFKIHLHGCKSGKPDRIIKIMQSEANRSKKEYIPCTIQLKVKVATKTSIGRLHFAETTLNNTRRRGKRNPGQQFFHLVVTLMAHSGEETFAVVSRISDRLIVRTSSPGQFENDPLTNEPLNLLKMQNLILRQQLTAPGTEQAAIPSDSFDVLSNLRSSNQTVQYNCQLRYININGVERSSVFATRAIAAGEELILDTSQSGNATVPTMSTMSTISPMSTMSTVKYQPSNEYSVPNIQSYY